MPESYRRHACSDDAFNAIISGLRLDEGYAPVNDSETTYEAGTQSPIVTFGTSLQILNRMRTLHDRYLRQARCPLIFQTA